MYAAYRGFSELDHSVVEAFQGIPYETAEEFWNKSLRLYLGTDDEAVLKSVEDKARVVCYTRLIRRTVRRGGMDTEEGRKLVEHFRSQLIELLPRVDALTF